MVTSSRFTLAILFLLGIQLVSCRNPLNTGVPVKIASDKMRATPQGVLNQLIEAYEKRQITLYKELFPSDGSFRFFVAPAFVNDYVTKYQQLTEVRDTRLKFIGQSDYYYYWTQDAEVESHKRLFSQAASIEFIEKPAVQSVDEFTDGGDDFAEVVITGGILRIGRNTDADTIEIWTSKINEQVFLLQKDEEDLWVIKKWYDFSSN